jgi:hypothetical protein
MKKEKVNCLLEKVRKKGRNGDTILAHINPLEAAMLKKAGGSGTINPKTGLPEFGGVFSDRYWRKGAWKRDLAAVAGNVIGNMVLPGAGGIVGAALGSAAGTKIRGRNDYAPHMMKSAALATIAPTVAGLAGTGANAMGFTNVGHALTKYGNINAILPSLGLGNVFGNEGAKSLVGGAGANALLSQMSGSKTNPSEKEMIEGSQSGVSAGEDDSFMGKLKTNSKNYLTKPKNLLALGSLAMQYAGKEKKVTAAQKGRDAKAEMLAARLTPAEMAEQEQYDLAMEQARRRVARNKFLPEERININPLYNKVSSPQEYNQSKRWLSYYDNPQFTGQPIRF